MIIQLRLELAEANSELAKTLKKLLDTECELFEARKLIPKPPSALDIYETTVESVKKEHDTLLYKVYSKSWDSEDITTGTFAQAVVRHLDNVKSLARMEGGLVPAFDLMMQLAYTCWYEPGTTNFTSESGDSDEPFQKLDVQLFSLINMRLKNTETQEAADAADWPATAFEYLMRTNQHLSDFGVYDYFNKSIDKLDEMSSESSQADIASPSYPSTE
jgi:hypothetical protein